MSTTARCGCVSKCACVVQALDTDCFDMTVGGAGDNANPYTISGSPKTNPGCPAIFCTPDGLCVDGGTHVQAADTNCIDVIVTGSGTAVDPFIVSANPKINPGCSALFCDVNGLCVDGGSHIQALDTPSVDITITGTGTAVDPFIISAVSTGSAVTTADTDCMQVNGDGSIGSPITAVPIFNPGCSAIFCTPQGICVDGGSHVQALDTPTINTTVTGTGTAGDPFIISSVPIIAPECNGLEATASGLSVPPSSDVGNNLTCGTDGRLFVPTGAATVATADSDCMQVNGDGSAGNPITAVPIFNPGCPAIFCTPQGLCVDGGSHVQALDTPCFDMTVTGSGTFPDPFIVSGSPIIDTSDPCRAGVECGPNGLRLNGPINFAEDQSVASAFTCGGGGPAGPFNGTFGETVIGGDTGLVTITNPSSCRSMLVYRSATGIANIAADAGTAEFSANLEVSINGGPFVVGAQNKLLRPNGTQEGNAVSVGSEFFGDVIPPGGSFTFEARWAVQGDLVNNGQVGAFNVCAYLMGTII